MVAACVGVEHLLRHRLVVVGVPAGRDRLDRARLVLEDRAVDSPAAVGKRGVGAGHVERRRRLRAEADCEVALERRQDAEFLGGVRDALRADERGQLREHRVVGDGDRLGQIDGAEGLALVVVDDPQPAACVDRHLLRRGEGAGRRDVLPQRGREHKGLERGAGLALALGREVELVLVVVGTADHREHRAGIVLGVDRDERDRGVDAVLGQHRGDRLARDLLQVDVEGRRHLQAAAEGLLRPELVDKLILDVVREVGGRVALGRRQSDVPRVGHRIDERVHELALGEIALCVQLPQHQVAAGPRQVRMRDRVPEARVLGDPREQCRLGRLHRRRAVVEVDLARLLDAVGAVSEVDRVQVRGEDLVLGPFLLQLPRERRLDQLAADGLLARQIGVLDELLRDRRAALHRAAVRDVGPERTCHAAEVDAAVLVEALVLDRDDRMLQPRRDSLRRDDDPRLRPAQDREHRVVVRGVDVGVRLRVLP